MPSSPARLPRLGPNGFAAFWVAVKDVVRLPAWWRQQAWVTTTELLMGFLAAWGVIRGIPGVWVGGGLALVYAVNSAGIWGFRKYGRRAGLAAVMSMGLVLLITGWVGGMPRWMGLCATVGVLLAFRDHQSVHSMAWLPLRALRRKVSSIMGLTAGAVCGAILLAVSLSVAGFVAQQWKWLPHAIVVISFCTLVPAQLSRMGRGTGNRKVPASDLPAHDADLTWLLRLGVAFNAVNFLGRRLVLPAAILAVATQYGGAESALPWLGMALGLMGVIGTLARMPLAMSNIDGRTLMRWGARASLVGWVTVAWGTLAWSWLGTAWALGPMLLGWCMLELTNRTWAVAYMEALRESAVGPRFSASRSHRRALNRFMVHKSAGGALGCLAGGLVTGAWVPAVVAALALGCWGLLERGPQTDQLP